MAFSATLIITNTDGQSVTLSNAFSFNQAPSATLPLAPSSGPASGGTAVKVSGSNFEPGATVVFVNSAGQQVPALNVQVAADGNSLTFVTPALS